MNRSLIAAVLITAACSVTGKAPASRFPGLSPEAIGAVQLTNRSAFPEWQREALDQVSHSLISSGENPSEFYAVVQERASEHVLEFALWHSTAFLPENQNVLGNPGGRCRSVEVDLVTRKVVRTLMWQQNRSHDAI
jgi:hypothetical protein